MKTNLAFVNHSVFILLEYFLGVFVILLSILFEGISQNLQGEELPDSSGCCECHNDIFEADLTKSNVHPPFLQRQCSVCHIDDGIAPEEVDNVASTENISWLDANFSLANKHWFNIPVDRISSDQLIVVASDDLCESHIEKLSLSTIGMLQEIANESTPYTITPELLGVYRGIFISAVIGWTTEEESDSVVHYGIDSLKYLVKADEFTTDHEIVLQDLKSNQEYQYIVISEDIFGNRVESEIAFFSTEKLSPAPPVKYKQHQETDIELDAQFFRNNDSYFVIITANHPVTIMIGTEIINEKDEKVLEASISNDQNHYLSMRNGNGLMVSVCIKCHPGKTHMVEHKINKFPPKGTQISADYSTNSDGRITCVTCHANHASNYQFRTIKPASQELCVGCHKGYLAPGRQLKHMISANH
jgi:predicted CXXCH cytochrome family protein